MNRESLIDRSSFVLSIPDEDDESSKSLAEDFNHDEADLSEDIEWDEKSLTEDCEFLDMKTWRANFSRKESLTKNNWQMNVIVKFDTNPASVIKFGEDLKSKRVVVTEAPDGLHLLKDLPILSVDEQHVSNLDCLLLEEKLAMSHPPVVIKFGSEPLEVDRSSDCSLGPGLSPFEDHIEYLGQTSSRTYEDIGTPMKGAYMSTLEVVQEESTEVRVLDVLPDDVTIYLPKEPQPISLEGTHGDMSSWSKSCKERAKIITELLNTEKSYIGGLEKLNKQFLELFVTSLKKSLNVDISSFAREVESLIFLHDKIYENLCSAENLCTVFQKEFKFMKMYKSYIKNYEETFIKLQQASKKRAFKPIFKSGEEMVAQDPLGFFNALGITIVQRPPRYILLLEQLKKNTPIGHSMYQDLEKALTEIESTCGDINEYQRQNESKLIQMSKHIDYKTLCAHGVKQLLVPSRRLIREGEVGIKTVKSSRLSFRRGDQGRLTLEMGRILMCNDILIVMYGRKNRVNCVFELAKIEVELGKEPIKPSNSNKQFDKVFQVILRNRSADEMEKVNREKCKSLFTKQHRNKTRGLSQTLTVSSVGLLSESFSIYLSTQAEAEEWKDSIVKYSSVQVVN